MHQITLVAAGAGAATLVLGAALSTPAVAACRMYPEPDSCTMMWTVTEDFWVGEYTVEAGTVHMTFDGRAHTVPPEPLSMATIFQVGGNLVIQHPEVVLNAELVSVALDAPPWRWGDALDDGMPAVSLGDVELMADCTNAEMPRWSAPVRTAEGVEMTLDLVAVGPYNIYGLLHADTVFDGVAVTLRRQINFTRGSYPVDGLSLFTEDSDGACDEVCTSHPFRCPGY